MKCNFKISLPLYKLLYSMVFMFVMALIRPTVTPVEILTVIEPNLCFLAIVFVADIYYCEFRENRINVFYLFPDRLKYKAVVQRFLIDFGKCCTNHGNQLRTTLGIYRHNHII